jgi:hypothetical protein
MTAIEQAEDLRQKAIALLLAERSRLDAQLTSLGYGQEKAPTGKRRGRKPKIQEAGQQLPASHSETREQAAI